MDLSTFSSGLLAANYGPDWPGIATLLAAESGHLQDQLIDAGITSFKIEGRMKSPYYVATVTGAYRRQLDALADGTATPALTARLMRELDAASHRPYASGFYFGAMKHHAPAGGAYLQDCVFVGVVRERLPGGRVRVEQRNRVRAGDVLEVLTPNALGLSFTAQNMTDAAGTPIDAAAVPMTLFDLDAPDGIEPGDMLQIRKQEQKTGDTHS